ncbi:MAG: hypothetical protein MI862_02930, partial [Desulfobacterales bacterium]|nr:hypothetical protein [Desulfobacterales bacterium]
MMEWIWYTPRFNLKEKKNMPFNRCQSVLQKPDYIVLILTGIRHRRSVGAAQISWSEYDGKTEEKRD